MTWVHGGIADRVDLDRDVVLVFDRYPEPVFVVGRFVALRGNLVFATTQAANDRLQALGFNPLNPSFWNYYPTEKTANV
jgi:hypothetical protein